ncbi:hypothetical protein ACLOJK_026319 [Asimina triloba]
MSSQLTLTATATVNVAYNYKAAFFCRTAEIREPGLVAGFDYQGLIPVHFCSEDLDGEKSCKKENSRLKVSDLHNFDESGKQWRDGAAYGVSVSHPIQPSQDYDVHGNSRKIPPL